LGVSGKISEGHYGSSQLWSESRCPRSHKKRTVLDDLDAVKNFPIIWRTSLLLDDSIYRILAGWWCTYHLEKY
jgi:hypothetical protein